MQQWVKHRTDAPVGLFAAEAAGLSWLRVPGGADVVQVIEATDQSITLAGIEPTTPTRAAARAFGEALARTHDAGARSFGCGPDRFTGPSFIADLPMPTDSSLTWGAFFAQQRVMHYAELARAELIPSGRRALEMVADRLADGVFDDDTPPARLHGDLWSGNVLFSPTGVVMIDPSAHGGHRISDLAMVSLFGAPFLDDIFDAYEQSTDHLPSDWRNLIGLHQIYPLLVHTVLFGGGYAAAAVRAAQRYL